MMENLHCWKKHALALFSIKTLLKKNHDCIHFLQGYPLFPILLGFKKCGMAWLEGIVLAKVDCCSLSTMNNKQTGDGGGVNTVLTVLFWGKREWGKRGSLAKLNRSNQKFKPWESSKLKLNCWICILGFELAPQLLFLTDVLFDTRSPV